MLFGCDFLLALIKELWGHASIWGGSNKECVVDVDFMVFQINLLLKEYLSSGDIQEATRCLTELDVPHFHHEFVYEVGTHICFSWLCNRL